MSEVKNIQLPILITENDLQKYPEFKKLLERLTEYIDEDGSSKDVKRKYTEVQESLKQEKLQYLRAKVIYDELKELCFVEESNRKSDDATSNVLKDALTAAECAEYLHFNPERTNTEETLLGLKAEELLKNQIHSRNSVQQRIIHLMDDKLRKKCEELADYYFNSNSDCTDSKFSFAKAAQLPALIEADKFSIEEANCESRKEMIAKNEQYVNYYETLVRSLDLTEKLITQYKVEWQKQCDEITCDWLDAKCHALCLKISVLQNQLLCDTYTPESVRALGRIRESLDARETEVKNELHHVVQSLTTYKALGMGFDDLVKRYGEILAEIENKKWALSELTTLNDDNEND